MNISAEERFWRKTKKDETTGCLLWIGAPDSSGYGSFWFLGKTTSAHKLAMLFAGITVPPHLNVLHSCDNRLCVNKDHLFLGTQKVNVQDCIDKGRRANLKGENAGNSKLTEAEVRIIKEGLRQRKTHLQLALEFNVNESTIQRIAARQIWRHVSLTEDFPKSQELDQTPS